MGKDREKELQQEVEGLKQEVQNERALRMNTEYEMLKRLYPYMAAEIDYLKRPVVAQDAPIAVSSEGEGNGG